MGCVRDSWNPDHRTISQVDILQLPMDRILKTPRLGATEPARRSAVRMRFRCYEFVARDQGT
jgi:hypothetical protein